MRERGRKDDRPALNGREGEQSGMCVWGAARGLVQVLHEEEEGEEGGVVDATEEGEERGAAAAAGHGGAGEQLAAAAAARFLWGWVQLDDHARLGVQEWPDNDGSSALLLKRGQRSWLRPTNKTASSFVAPLVCQGGAATAEEPPPAPRQETLSLVYPLSYDDGLSASR